MTRQSSDDQHFCVAQFLEANGRPTAPDGRLFRSERGGMIQPSTWYRSGGRSVASLTPEQLATPLMERPYDLRHAGISWRLNSGVPAPDVAKWAGHSVEVLTRIYASAWSGWTTYG